ncbi:MAG: hypothetical protein RL299_1314 [Pseudomonadota bacterium]|jgi:hypothetical protein
MRKAAILTLMLLATACKDRAPVPAETAPPASAAPAAAAPAPAAKVLPAAAPASDPAAEVTRLAQRIEACEHFAGEEPYDAARAAELRQQVEANCPGNEAELARLRARHAKDPALTKRLDRLKASAN